MIKIKNARALYIEKDKIWIARGLCFFAIDFDGDVVSKKYKLGSSIYNIRVLRPDIKRN